MVAAPMNQFSLLTEEHNDQRFHITGPKAIVFALDGFIHRRDQFSVYFNDGKEGFLTHLLATRPATGEVIVDCSGSPEVNARFLKSPRSVFVAKPEGINVQFVATQASRVAFRGGDAFAVPLPRFIVRLQRREFFRIATPRAKPVLLAMRLAPEGKELEYPIHDLSVAGCGLSAGSVPAEVHVGLSVPGCRFLLPDAHKTQVVATGTVRHGTVLSGHHGSHQCRIGLQFEGLEASVEHSIQRYIAQVEHLQRELAK